MNDKTGGGEPPGDNGGVFMRMQSFIGLAAALALSACGGGTNAFLPVLPGASNGFATPASNVKNPNQGVTFVDGPKLVAFAPGSASLSTSTVQLANADATDNQIEVTINGVTFAAVEKRDILGNIISYDGTSGGRTISVKPVAVETFAQLNAINEQDGAGGGTSGYSVSGFATDPTVIADKGTVPAPLPVTAFYLGNSFIDIHNGTGTPAFNAGDLAVFVDFAAGDFFGSMDLNTVPNQPVVNVTFYNGTINGHMMNANIIVNAGQLGMDPSAPPTSTNLTGSFFGPDAENVGGHFSITGNTTAGTPVVAQGGFVGKK